MAEVNKNIYYYLILFATFIFSFSFIPIVFEVIQQKITSNIPYISLIGFFISYLIYLFISIDRKYYFHILLYIIGLLCISIILFIKREHNKLNFTTFES
jgi:uncharacterized protein with PQ loop repeat